MGKLGEQANLIGLGMKVRDGESIIMIFRASPCFKKTPISVLGITVLLFHEFSKFGEVIFDNFNTKP